MVECYSHMYAGGGQQPFLVELADILVGKSTVANRCSKTA